MSIASIFPPMCDEADGHLLVDGAYVNNVPASVMRARGARYILAFDVGSQDDTDLTNYGDSLSGWWLLWQKLTSHFRTTKVKVPSLADIQSRLAYVSCTRQLEELRNSDYCHYVRPPIDKYKTLQFSSFDEIKEVGYNHAKTYFLGMMKGGSMPPFYQGENSFHYGLGPINSHQQTKVNLPGRPPSPMKRSVVQQRPAKYSFIDLAEMICKIKNNFPSVPVTDEDYSDDDTDYPGYTSDPEHFLHDGATILPTLQTAGKFYQTKPSTHPKLISSASLSENEYDSEFEHTSKN